MKVLSVFGTRPEVIKMAALVQLLKQADDIESYVCLTGQHIEMVSPLLDFFNIQPDFDLAIMKEVSGLSDIVAIILKRLDPILRELKPDIVLVQGDTSTAFAAGLAAFHEKIPVGHVEAGLRSHRLYSPFPEEANRHLLSVISALNFAPTNNAKNHLLKENINPDSIHLTGNTVIDSLLQTSKRINSDVALSAQFDEKFSFLNPDKKLILVTGHRRESFGHGFENICHALNQIAKRDDVEILYPVHLNPQVKGPVYDLLGQQKNIRLIQPVDYPLFVYLMNRSYLILTDSGGIQEEAPSLGKPVLVMREVTERIAGVEAGTVRLVGTDIERIVSGTNLLLDNHNEYDQMCIAHNPYGDGHAAMRIVGILREHFNLEQAGVLENADVN